MTDTHLIDAAGAGELLCMIPSRVQRLARRRILPHIALPDGELRFRAGDLMEWAAQYYKPGELEELSHDD